VVKSEKEFLAPGRGERPSAGDAAREIRAEIAREYRLPLGLLGLRAVDRLRRAAPTWLSKSKIHQKEKWNVAGRSQKGESDMGGRPKKKYRY
jgi:hypothetical protein